MAQLCIFLIVWALYTATAAPGTIFGDPSEYQFIPAIWGIAHPPGYAFYTLLAGIWQRVVAVGSVAFRTNVLAGAAGAWTVSRVFAIIVRVGHGESMATTHKNFFRSLPVWGAACSAALALAVAPDMWQHSIHANAHIVSVAITSTQLWVFVRWWQGDGDRWLFALAFLCGIGVTHHPITVWGLPAYAVFILLNRPQIFKQPKTILFFVLCGFLGLLPWLYFPFRSLDAPFGPTDMRTWPGFLRHATAQGLRVNLFHFGWAEQIDRWRVLWTLLRLQYPWPFLLVMIVGIVILVRRWPKLAVLWGLFLLGHLIFTLNSVQDVMAYMLHPFMALAFLVGVGALAILEFLNRICDHRRAQICVIIASILLLGIPVGVGIYTFPRISLRDWNDADLFFARLVARFEQRDTRAAFVSDWEHLTPYFYYTYVEDVQVAEEDLRHVYVTGDSPWAESVFGNLPLGPVYLSNYRREIRDLGFRLRPEGDMWRVLEPPATEPVAPQYPLENVWAGNRVELVGYDLPVTSVPQGGIVPVILYARVVATQTGILMPFALLGTVEQRWTTDSRCLTPEWLPGEIIVERYEVYVPYTLSPDIYPLQLGYTDMTETGVDLFFTDGQRQIVLGDIVVTPHATAAREGRVVSRALTNIGNDVALMSARVHSGWQTRTGIWDAPLSLQPGQPFHLTLDWQVLARPRTSYTVFIHLIDAGGVPRLGHDYTPLGGAFPSYLWFPKWLEGQRVIDPYRLTLPEDLPPGQYWLEVGMYEMGSVRRIPQFSVNGTMTGDRFILGPVVVE